MKDISAYTDEEILAEAHKVCLGYKMKTTLRYNTTRDFTVHSESNAEHVFACIYLAYYFLHREPAAQGLNALKVDRILLFHDFGEITHGDVPYHLKTKEHVFQEREDAKEIFAALPEPLNVVGRESWDEFEERTSPEARFAYAIDKIEPLFELLHPINEKTMKELKFNRDMHMGKKLKATEGYPVMRRFLDVITADMDARDVFWKE